MPMTIIRTRLLWLSCAALGTGTLVALALFVAIEAVPLALSADDLADGFSEIADSRLEEPEMLVGLSARVGDLETSASSAAAGGRWVGALASAFSWLPGLDRAVYAWAAQADRLETDLALASDLLSASSDLLAAYEAAEVALLDVRADSAASTLPKSTADLEAAFSAASLLLDNADGYRLRLPGLHLPRISRALETLGEAEDQLRFASDIGLLGAWLLVDLLAAGESVRPLLSQFVDGASDGPAVTYEGLVASLKELGELGESASNRSAEMAAKIEESGESLDLLVKLADLQLVLAALRNIGTSASTVLDIMGPVLQSEGTGLFSEGGSMIAAVDAVNNRLSDVSGAVADLELAQRLLSQVSQSGNGAGGLGDVIGMVDSLHDGIELLLEMAPLGRELLGADGPRKYLVLGQSADELRASGGSFRRSGSSR